MRQLYHERPRNTSQKHQLPNVPGGTYSIPPIALIILWAAYRQRRLDWLAVRIWIALWEIKCWYEAASERKEAPRYDTSQITSAIKSPNMTTKRLQSALIALEHLNLVSFTSTNIWVATSLDDLHHPELRQLAAQMLSDIGYANTGRALRMPRRMLVFLMRSQRPRPVYAGVMFALLIRTMLTKRYEIYKGCCKASWIALVFGGDPSSIKAARTQLIADGWFARLETPQRVRQRYGEWVLLVVESPVENQNVTEPPKPQKSEVTEPPLKNQSLSDEIETNQSLQAGASQPEWDNIQPLDLHTPRRRERLYQAALAAGVIRPTEIHRNTFFAAIARATRVATRNACGLLRRLVETPDYHRFISQFDEDQANRWLKALPRTVDPSATEPLSADARFVRLLRRNLTAAGLHGDPYSYLSSTPKGQSEWPPERWHAATFEVLTRGDSV